MDNSNFLYYIYSDSFCFKSRRRDFIDEREIFERYMNQDNDPVIAGIFDDEEKAIDCMISLKVSTREIEWSNGVLYSGNLAYAERVSLDDDDVRDICGFCAEAFGESEDEEDD